MKIVASLLIMLIGLSANGNAQNCCARPKGMSALALNASFKAAHEPPLPLAYTAEKGEIISFTTQGGAEGHAFYVPADGKATKTLIICHEWWGLNDYIKREAESWQKQLGDKVEVYAVDLYDGQVATTPDEAGKLMSSLDQKRGAAILAGLVDKIGKGKKIATLGWCMGGCWSFAATLTAGSEATGCVMYYGFPEKDEQKIKKDKADVLYLYAKQDNFIKEADVKEFGSKVKESGHKFTFHSFDAVHAFANPSNPKYNEKAAAEAKVYALKFLKEKLGIE